MISRFIDPISTNRLIGFCVLTALVLAAWIQYIQHGWVNPDSTLYFEQAKRFSTGDLAGVFSVYPWPLYGICIGLVHQLTTLSIHLSAQCLNVIFFGIATYAYLKIIKLAHGTNRTIFFGALLLFSSQYIVGDVLEMLMRDEGFWAFYLGGLFFFIRFLSSQKMTDAVAWQCCIITATLFRLEAIIYLLLLPALALLILRLPYKKYFALNLKAYSLVITLLALTVFYFALHPELSTTQLGRLNDLFTSDFYIQMTNKLSSKADLMGHEVLGRYLDDYSLPALLTAFLMILISKSFVATGFITSILAYFSIKHAKQPISPYARLTLLVTAILAIIVAGLIIIKVFVLSKRYLVAFVWIMLIFASFQLAKLSKQQQKPKHVTLVVLSIILGLSLVKNILPKRNGYNYQQTAVAWLHKANQSNASVYYSDSRLRYYANADFLKYGDLWPDFTKQVNTSTNLDYQYLVIPISKRDQYKLDFLADKLRNYQEIKRFYAPANKKYCAIYQKITNLN